VSPPEVPRFARRFFDPTRRISRIGDGPLGGKATGLVAASRVLAARRDEIAVPGLEADVPALVVLAADAFDSFLDRNDLRPLVSEEPADEAVSRAFARASLPAEWLGDLRALAQDARCPLAIRSSSILEDALLRPFAGVYGTKMIPGNQPDTDARFRSLVDAIKFVYATTFFREARAYRRAAGELPSEERMAVLVQEVVGRRHAERFYPDVSGVARSWNFYPSGPAEPREGVVDLALGLGKTIVDGEARWTFSPAHPRRPPPVGSSRELLDVTQGAFWAIGVGPPPPYDPMTETEYLVRPGLDAAEKDGTLRHAASTYDPASDRLVAGLSRPGPRVLDFAPLLVQGEIPLVDVLRRLLAFSEEALGAPVEIEFAMTMPPGKPARLGFLQIRPLLVSRETTDVDARDLEGPAVVVASASALGNGVRELGDVVFVERASFERRLTPAIALEIERLNRRLVEEARPYLLVGFGRWGSADPWLGIPVRWDQIAGARGIVEAALPEGSAEPSQGSHFFHNLSSFGVLYFTVPHPDEGIDWEWLESREMVARTDHVRHVRVERPLVMRVDGRARRGVVLRSEAP